MDLPGLSITKPKMHNQNDFDIFKFWKGDTNDSLFLMLFFLTIDIYEMGLYRAIRDPALAEEFCHNRQNQHNRPKYPESKALSSMCSGFIKECFRAGDIRRLRQFNRNIF